MEGDTAAVVHKAERRSRWEVLLVEEHTQAAADMSGTAATFLSNLCCWL